MLKSSLLVEIASFETVLRSGPDGSGQAVGFIWSLFRDKPSILDPFRVIFDTIWGRTDIVDPTWNSRTRSGMAPWSGLDLSQRLRNGPGMLLDHVSGQTVDSTTISDQI